MAKEANDLLALVVEDEYDSVQMVSKILSFNGFHVQIAHNGYECIDLLETIEPHIIIMDLALPKMDGWETLVNIRANPDTAHIPVVAITAYHSADVAEVAKTEGFDAYYPKPVNPTRFYDDVMKLIDPT
ncbi:MAG: response regulator [Anaerolineales bacterium]